MPPKPGYKQPGREGKVALPVWIDPSLRDDFKIAAIEHGTTMQEALENFIVEFAGDVTKRRNRAGRS